MKTYQIVVKAYQTVEVEAEDLDQAKDLALDIGIDLSSCEWEVEPENRFDK